MNTQDFHTTEHSDLEESYKKFIRQMSNWYNGGELPELAGQDLRFALELQRQKLQKQEQQRQHKQNQEKRMEKLLHIASEKETERIGEAIGRAAEPGTVVALIGDLGTGKTTLTKSIARGLGVTETVTSPTFNIIREYKSGRIPLYHFDVYRIGDPDEMFELGYEEYFYGDGICVVEWADIIEELLPEDAVIIRIERGASEEEREYRIESEDGKLCIF